MRNVLQVLIGIQINCKTYFELEDKNELENMTGKRFHHDLIYIEFPSLQW